MSLKRMMAMHGERVYVFARRAWAVLDASGPYPLLCFEDGECTSWEDWPDIQAGGIHKHFPALKCRLADRRPEPGRI